MDKILNKLNLLPEKLFFKRKQWRNTFKDLKGNYFENVICLLTLNWVWQLKKDVFILQILKLHILYSILTK